MRVNSSEIDEIIASNYYVPVLDDGFVRVVDYMGTDSSIVQAARVSYGDGTKKMSEDEALIRYLMRHYHTTPFEMCEIKFHVRVPMDCWRQWVRHRTASVNEYSTRYSFAIDSNQKTSQTEWRLQSSVNKQGSNGYLYSADDGKERTAHLTNRECEFLQFSKEIYQERLDYGISREQARKDLPLSTYTEAYWKIDLHNLLHFLHLRQDYHAQYEIRQYANAIGDFVSRWVPMTWRAFNDYRVNNMNLSALEISVMSCDDQIFMGQELGWLDNSGKPKNVRERVEFEEKMKILNQKVSWNE